MPNRIIKESICYSDDLDKLTPFEETVFYRLIVRADDYGRLDARPSFLKSMLFVTKPGITEKNIQDAVSKLASIGLVRLYSVDGKSFLLFPKWNLHQRVRNSKAKYPEPQNEASFDNSPQLAATCGLNPIQSESQSESQSKRARGAKGVNAPDLSRFSTFVGKAVENWLSYKAEKRQSYKGTGLEMLLNKIEKQVSLYGETAVVGLIEESMANNWQGIAWGKLEKSTPKRLRPEDIEL